MRKIKTLIRKNWLYLYLISGILASLALYTLPNLSNLALQTALPSSELSNRAQQLKRHWGTLGDNAVPITITYSVPTEFSPSQKLRLENKERFLIEHKRALRIYRVTSAHTSPHAQSLFNGRNWRTFQLWIPAPLLNQPLYQARLRHLCALSGLQTQWHNPLNQTYRKLSVQWFQQKIIISWILIGFFLLLLLLTSLSKALLLSVANVEISLLILGLITHLPFPFFFYLPLIIVLSSSTLIIRVVISFSPPQWITRLKNPMHNWHPLIVLGLLTGLIVPLLTNCQLHFQAPPKNQSVTVYLTSSHSMITPANLSDLDHLTKVLQSLPNVSQVTSLTQPGGREIPKYQLGLQVQAINHALAQKQQLTQAVAHQMKTAADNQTVLDLLNDQKEQLNQLQDENKHAEHDDLQPLIKRQTATQAALLDQIKHTQRQLQAAHQQLKQTKTPEETKALKQIQQQTKHQFYLTAQDAHDSDFNQTDFNHNNAQQTTTRLEIRLRNGHLGNLPTVLKSHLIGTNFSHKIGMLGLPVLEAQKAQTFHQFLPLVILFLSLSLLMINWFKFKSLGFASATVLLVYVIGAAGLGTLNYLTAYHFTPETCYLFLFCITLLALFNQPSHTFFPTLLITIPFFLVPSFREYGLALATNSIFYQLFLAELKQFRHPNFSLIASHFLKN